jgi:hypothetical protein
MTEIQNQQHQSADDKNGWWKTIPIIGNRRCSPATRIANKNAVCSKVKGCCGYLFPTSPCFSSSFKYWGGLQKSID